MDISWGSSFARARGALRELEEILDDDVFEDRSLIVAYVEAKRRLAEAMQAFAISRYADVEPMLRVRRQLETFMAETYLDVPERNLRVLGFGAVHEILLAYLMSRPGTEVSADELRILTRDAVHTERRARDLRDLGFRITSRKSAGLQVYVLEDPVPDIGRASAVLVAKNLREDKSLSRPVREKLLARYGLVDLSQDLTDATG